MDFFGIGPGELLLILVVALIVLGPGRLPEVARNLGKMVREFRKATSEVTREFTLEVEKEESKSKLPQTKEQVSQVAPDTSPQGPQNGGRAASG